MIGVRAVVESPTGPVGAFVRRCRLATVGGGLVVLWAMTWLIQDSVLDSGGTVSSGGWTGLSRTNPATWLLALAIVLGLAAALSEIGRTRPVALSALALTAAVGGLLIIPSDLRFEAIGARIDYEWSAAPIVVLILCGLLLALTLENRRAVRRGRTQLAELETTPMTDPAERTAERDVEAEVQDALHRSLVFGCAIALLVLLTATWEKDGWNPGQANYRTGFGLVTSDLTVPKTAMAISLVVLAILILYRGDGLPTMILPAAGLVLTLLMLVTLPADVTTGGTAANRYEWLPAPYVALVIWAVALITGWHARTVKHRR
jgi:hypothetical protein